MNVPQSKYLDPTSKISIREGSLQSASVSRPTLKLPDYERITKCRSSLNLFSLDRADSLDSTKIVQIQIQPFFAWILLLFNVFSASLVPCWLMGDVKAESLTRNAWRYLMLSLLTVPFVSYQKRMIKLSKGDIFQFISLDNIKRCFICSINFCSWVLISIQATKLTSLTHTFTLVRLKFFALTFIKLRKKQLCHDFQIGGTLLVVSGILCMFYDSFVGQIEIGIDNQLYLQRSNIKRILGDLLAFSASFLCAYLDEKYQIPSSPRFINLFLYNFFVGFNFISFGYFFGGSEFSLNSKYGVFGIFDQQNFVNIFYVSIMLGLNLMITNILVNQIFSELIQKVAGCFEVLLTSFLYSALNLQITHSGYTYLSFGFIVPGMLLIISGQNILKQKDVKVDYIIYRSVQEDQQEEKQQEEKDKKQYFIQLQLVKDSRSEVNEKKRQQNFRVITSKRVNINDIDFN